MPFVNSSPRLGVPALDAFNTAAEGPALPLGTIVTGVDTTTGAAGEFMYVQFAAITNVGDACALDLNTSRAVRASSALHANSGAPIGFAMPLSTGAINAYGFVQISGLASVRAAPATVVGAKVMLTATAGTVDDAAIAGAQVVGATFASVTASNFSLANLNRPAMQTQIT